MLAVQKSELKDLSFIGSGNYGVVYRTEYTMHPDPTELVYKEFKSKSREQGQVKPGDRMMKAVSFWDQNRRQAEQAELDKFFAWPREAVQDEPPEAVPDDTPPEPCGYLMQIVPEDFWWPKDSGRHAGKPRSLDWLVAPERRLQKNGIDLSDITVTDRLLLMTQLAFAFAWLHKRGWVLGDFNFANGVFALRPPRVMLLDCDDVTEAADPGRGDQPHTLHWLPPECEGSSPALQDTVTDVYKLGLAIVRCMKPEHGATSTSDVDRLTGILEPEGVELIRRAVAKDRGKRPLARDIFFYLEGVVRPLVEPPAIDAVELVTPLVAEGTHAHIVWRIRDADEIQLFVGAGTEKPVRTVTPTDYPDGCAFPVPQPGQVRVVATSRYGEATWIAGDVAQFPVPPYAVDLGDQPRAVIPAPPDLPWRPWPQLPVTDLAPPSIDPIPQPVLNDVLRDMALAESIASPAAQINQALDSSHDLMDAIQAEADRFSARLRRRKYREKTP